MRMLTLLLVCGVLPSSLLAQQPATRGAPPASAPSAETHLAIRANPPVDMHYYVRYLAAQPPDTELPEALRPAVTAARELEQSLGGAFGWGLIEGNLAACENAKQLHAAFQRLPAELHRKDGTVLPIKPAAVRLSEALVALESEFLRGTWPAHEKALAAARESLARRLGQDAAQHVAWMCESLAIPDPKIDIPVFLVMRAPDPGGFTHRMRRGGGVCFIAVDGVTELLLCETVLHEAIHALDIASESRPTALVELRRMLTKAGVERTSPLYRDVPHTLMFVQAGETVRRRIDANHRHYGEGGYYDKVSEVVAAVRPAWEMYLDGKCSREDALRSIATQFAPR